jgi:hypothetical protein
MNVNLVKGQAILAESKNNNWGEALRKGIMEGTQAVALVAAQEASEKSAISNKVASYINSLNEPDLTSLTPEQNSAVTNFLVEQRNQYANIAKEISKIDAAESPTEYASLRDKMNGIRNSFSNLANQVNAYKQDKLSYLKDFDDKRLSNGNSIGSLSKAAKIYTNEGAMGVGPGGQLSFFDEDAGEYKGYMEINKPFLKDFKSADSILKLNESIYNSGQPLLGARKTMVKSKLKNLISSGGRDTLVSLAADDFLVDGGLNIQDKKLFEPGNEDLLEEEVLSKYMDFLSETAAQGSLDKKPSGKGGGQGSGQGGLKGAIGDEIKFAQNSVLPSAFDFANLATVNAAPEQTEAKTKAIVNQINSVDPKAKAKPYVSRGELFNMFYDANKEEFDNIDQAKKSFKKQFGNTQIFRYNPSQPGQSVPLEVNVNNPRELYNFYIKNSDLSSKAKNYFISNLDSYIKSGNEEQPQKEKSKQGSGAYDNL